MIKCWSDDKESRPTFQELKQEFDDLISHAKGYKYMPLNGLATKADLDPAEESVEAPPHIHPTAFSDCQHQASSGVATEGNDA